MILNAKSIVFDTCRNGQVVGDAAPGRDVPVAGQTATFSSADAGMKTENAEKITRRSANNDISSQSIMTFRT